MRIGLPTNLSPVTPEMVYSLWVLFSYFSQTHVTYIYSQLCNIKVVFMSLVFYNASLFPAMPKLLNSYNAKVNVSVRATCKVRCTVIIGSIYSSHLMDLAC